MAALRGKYLYTAKDEAIALRGKCSTLRGMLGCFGQDFYFFCDWAMGSVYGMSYSGNAIYLNGDLIAWYIHKQAVVTVSSTEAECIVVSYASKDGAGKIQCMIDFVHVN